MTKAWNEHLDIALLDFSKTFVKVLDCHPRLCLKVEHLVLEIYKSGWENNRRVQRIAVKGKKSDPVHIQSGVTQGTALGSLLFLI